MPLGSRRPQRLRRREHPRALSSPELPTEVLPGRPASGAELEKLPGATRKIGSGGKGAPGNTPKRGGRAEGSPENFRKIGRGGSGSSRESPVGGGDAEGLPGGFRKPERWKAGKLPGALDSAETSVVDEGAEEVPERARGEFVLSRVPAPARLAPHDGILRITPLVGYAGRGIDGHRRVAAAIQHDPLVAPGRVPLDTIVLIVTVVDEDVRDGIAADGSGRQATGDRTDASEHPRAGAS